MKRIVAALFASSLLLAACGGSSSSGSSSPSRSGFNDADIAFAQGMIPHHRQAVAMADLALANGESQEVKDLATQIKGAQDPEIKTMGGWLKAWGQAQPSASGSMDGMDGMGMMSDKEMKTLGATKGATFDGMFLKMMITHHKGAVTMSKTERSKGSNADAKALAGRIISAQEAEIATMQKLPDGGK